MRALLLAGTVLCLASGARAQFNPVFNVVTTSGLKVMACPTTDPAVTGTVWCSNGVLVQSGSTVTSGGISADSFGGISSQLRLATGSVAERSLATAAHDVFNVLDYGATATGVAATIGNTYSSVTTPAQLAALSVKGNTPFSWATNSAYGLQFPMTVSAAASSGANTLQFVSAVTQGSGATAWRATYAAWEDPAHHEMLPVTGMGVSGTGIPTGTTITAIQTLPVRQTELLLAPGAATTWQAGQAYSVGTVRVANGNAYRVTTAIATSATAPTAATVGGTSADNSGVWTYICAATALTAETDWGAGTSYPTGSIVAANGATWLAINTATGTSSGGSTGSGVMPGSFIYGGPTYGASFNSAWNPAYIGTQYTDGGVTWLLLNRKEYRNVPTGAIVLSNTITSNIAAGAALTFTISPGALQALTLDWLAIQTAFAQATTAGAGEIVLPASASAYGINHQITNAALTSTTNNNQPAISVRGGGYGATTIQVTSDLGQRVCAIAEQNAAGSTPRSNTVYRDFQILGPSSTTVLGASPNAMDGLCLGESATAINIGIQSFHAGVTLTADHQKLMGVTLTNNGYNLLLDSYSVTIGNLSVRDSPLVGAYIASIGVMPTNQVDASDIQSVHTGFAPWGVYTPPMMPNATVADAAILSNTTFAQFFMESEGAEVIRANQGSGSIYNNKFIGGGSQSTTGNPFYQISNGVGGKVTPRAIVYAGYYTNNTHLGTTGDGFSNVSDAIYETVYDITGNLWIGDHSLIFGNGVSAIPTAALPALKAHISTSSGVGNFTPNRWMTADASGYFYLPGYGANVFANVPVKFVDANHVYFYGDGAAVAGITAAGCNSTPLQNQIMCPVVTDGLIATTAITAIGAGGAVFATSTGASAPGVVGGLDQIGAIGIAPGGCGAGAGCVVMLSGVARGGAPGFATLAASSSPIPTIASTHTDVTSGTGSVSLSLAVPVGGEAVICNDTSASINILPPSGGTYQDASTSKSLSVGSCNVYRRTASYWHS